LAITIITKQRRKRKKQLLSWLAAEVSRRLKKGRMKPGINMKQQQTAAISLRSSLLLTIFRIQQKSRRIRKQKRAMSIKGLNTKPKFMPLRMKLKILMKIWKYMPVTMLS